jgi:hypothetical protein
MLFLETVMRLTREEALQQIEGSWLLEIGGDETFRKAYDALWTNGPPNWTSEKFQERWTWMRQMLPRLHPKDVAVLWSVSVCSAARITIADAEGNYDVSSDEFLE